MRGADEASTDEVDLEEGIGLGCCANANVAVPLTAATFLDALIVTIFSRPPHRANYKNGRNDRGTWSHNFRLKYEVCTI